MPGIALVVLAAGSSSRLGSPKQLRIMANETLLQRTINAAKAADLDPILVVLGAHKEKISPHINIEDCTIIENDEWEEGMASSIHSAIKYLERETNSIDAVIFVTCDQPMLNAKILKAISTSFYKTGKLVASAYDGAIGIPALFPRSYFADLLNLEGKEGARKILRKSGATIEKVDFPGGGVDIDTEDDWNKFLQAGGESTMS